MKNIYSILFNCLGFVYVGLSAAVAAPTNAPKIQSYGATLGLSLPSNFKQFRSSIYYPIPGQFQFRTIPYCGDEDVYSYYSGAMDESVSQSLTLREIYVMVGFWVDTSTASQIPTVQNYFPVSVAKVTANDTAYVSTMVPLGQVETATPVAIRSHLATEMKKVLEYGFDVSAPSVNPTYKMQAGVIACKESDVRDLNGIFQNTYTRTGLIDLYSNLDTLVLSKISPSLLSNGQNFPTHYVLNPMASDPDDRFQFAAAAGTSRANNDLWFGLGRDVLRLEYPNPPPADIDAYRQALETQLGASQKNNLDSLKNKLAALNSCSSLSGLSNLTPALQWWEPYQGNLICKFLNQYKAAFLSSYQTLWDATNQGDLDNSKKDLAKLLITLGVLSDAINNSSAIFASKVPRCFNSADLSPGSYQKDILASMTIPLVNSTIDPRKMQAETPPVMSHPEGSYAEGQFGSYYQAFPQGHIHTVFGMSGVDVVKGFNYKPYDSVKPLDPAMVFQSGTFVFDLNIRSLGCEYNVFCMRN